MTVEGQQYKSDLSFLVLPSWWAGVFKSVLPLCQHFVLPALFFALSNCSGLIADASMRAGIDLGAIESGQNNLQQALELGAKLMGLSFLGLITGFIAMSYWLLNLTAIARYFLSPTPTSFSECLKWVKDQTKHLTGVWLVGTFYLLVPVVPLSVLLAFSMLGNFPITMFGEQLISVPKSALLFMNFGVALFSLISMDYSFILTVLSSVATVKASKVAHLSMQLYFRHWREFLLLNLLVIILDVLISTPFVFCSMIPSMAELSKNLAFGIACQLWLSLSSLLCWPLTIIAFAQFLKPLIVDVTCNE